MWKQKHGKCFTVVAIKEKRPSLAPVGSRHVASLLICIKLTFAQLCHIVCPAHFTSLMVILILTGNQEFSLKTNDVCSLKRVTLLPV